MIRDEITALRASLRRTRRVQASTARLPNCRQCPDAADRIPARCVRIFTFEPIEMAERLVQVHHRHAAAGRFHQQHRADGRAAALRGLAEDQDQVGDLSSSGPFDQLDRKIAEMRTASNDPH